jgi:glutathione synthase
MKALFIADSISELKPQSDTSLMILRGLIRRKIKVFWCVDQDLSWNHEGLQISANEIVSVKPFELPITKESKTSFSVKELDFTFIRKNPPFDKSYVNLCWLLAPYEKAIKIINRPSLLLRYHEKMLPLEAQVHGYLKAKDLIPTCITSDAWVAKNFIDEQDCEKYILKPFYGFAGHEIELVSKDELLQSLSKRFQPGADLMIQPLQDEIYELGDRRVFFFKGKYRGDFVRLPKKGSVVSNLAQGGSAAVRKLSEAEKKVVARIEYFLKDLKIDFAGADMIGEKVSEINITSPTGFTAYQNIFKKDLTEKFLDSIL